VLSLADERGAGQLPPLGGGGDARERGVHRRVGGREEQHPLASEQQRRRRADEGLGLSGSPLPEHQQQLERRNLAADLSTHYFRRGLHAAAVPPGRRPRFRHTGRSSTARE